MKTVFRHPPYALGRLLIGIVMRRTLREAFAVFTIETKAQPIDPFFVSIKQITLKLKQWLKTLCEGTVSQREDLFPFLFCTLAE